MKQQVERAKALELAGGSAAIEPLLAVRGDQQLSEKRRIGALAVDELPDSGTIVVDS